MLLEGLPESDAVALRDALADTVMSAADIRRVLLAEGFRVGITVLKEHRRGECVCVVG